MRSLRLLCPCLADELVGRKAFQGLEPAGEVVGDDEVGEVLLKLVVALLIEELDRGVLDGSVHVLDLTVGPRCLALVVRCSMSFLAQACSKA